jgi:hypothetical protein
MMRSVYTLGCSFTDPSGLSEFLVLVSSYDSKAQCHLLEFRRNMSSQLEWLWGDESMAQSRQAGMGDSLLTDSQTKGINKRCAKPPIVMKFAVCVNHTIPLLTSLHTRVFMTYLNAMWMWMWMCVRVLQLIVACIAIKTDNCRRRRLPLWSNT